MTAETREGTASLSLGSAKEIGRRRLAQDEGVVDRLVALGEEGMASGIDETFDINAFIKEFRTAS